ncbi:zf-HC2 domain-containing protein [Prosthecochloris sp. SCSIO W1101]|uniref:anti-sigma factor family protein n=1 Tax=Prosthecochloris sp. SCSIO W1101 TaxID=2992242 RepID=UPI00223E1E0C|nr:hypothetical protein [Prosthecochloris sp. SCSIO W1101]UZJ42558.1 zf-HC2 domain-containing protein [Prosthecochloris sp. SCSIO W1101]
MKCTEAEHLIAEMALGFISESQRKELEDHLSVCAQCRQEAEHYSVAVEALKPGVSERMISAEEVESVVSSGLGRKSNNNFKLLKLGGPVLAAAAVFLAIVISPMFFSGNSGDMTRLEVLEAYAEDIEATGMENGYNYTMYNTEFNYEHYGVSDTVSEYLVR